MTKPLYLWDSYLREFDAKVEHVEQNRVILNQSAFHPLTGGVSYDVGFLTKDDRRVRVVKVEINRETKETIHLTENESTGLNPGDPVKGSLDWERRYRLMRLHTAAHLISAIMYNDYTALITGGQVDVDYAKLDFNLPKTDREIFETAVQKATKQAIEGVPVKTYFLSRDEALKTPGAVKLAEKMPPEEKELRMVEITDLDLQADGGPHVKNTTEIGKINLLKIENKGKNQRRMYFDVK